jgi:hypothetical protein
MFCVFADDVVLVVLVVLVGQGGILVLFWPFAVLHIVILDRPLGSGGKR